MDSEVHGHQQCILGVGSQQSVLPLTMSDPFSDPHSRPNMPVPKSTQDSARDAAAYDYSRSKLARSQTS